MNLSQTQVDDYLHALLVDQALFLGEDLAPLLQETLNPISPTHSWITLMCMGIVLVTQTPNTPITRWFPGLPHLKAHRLLFLTMHDVMMEYLSGERTTQDFEQKIRKRWLFILRNAASKDAR